MGTTAIGIAVTGIISLITAVLGFLFGQRKVHLEFNKELAIEIWKERCTQYKKLIHLMEVLPKWPNEKGKVKYSNMLETAGKLKGWYFAGGGLFLSFKSRNCYFDVQIIITEHLLNNNFADENKLDEFLDDITYEKVRGKMSSLRTELTNDLLSRERNIFNVEKDIERDYPKKTLKKEY